MEGYRDQIPAFISLFRALFGDFDIDEIMDNSSGYLNALFFLTYLFVAIFIMLSMFLAILAEAFNRYDGDRHGTMDREEMAKALNELELPDPDDVARLRRQSDVQGDEVGPRQQLGQRHRLDTCHSAAAARPAGAATSKEHTIAALPAPGRGRHSPGRLRVQLRRQADAAAARIQPHHSALPSARKAPHW